jgi:Domain of unknown function (DUF4268)
MFYGNDVKARFRLLQEERQTIEEQLATPLEWAENPGKLQSYIYLHRRDLDPTVKEQWPEQYQWLYEKLEAFKRVLAPKIRNLDVSRYQFGGLNNIENEHDLALEEGIEPA